MALSAGSVEIRLFAELARLQSDMKKANKVVEDAMGGIEKTVKSTSKVFTQLAGAFGSAQIIRLADDYKRFDSQLKLSTRTLADYNEAYANTIRIGRTAQSDIGAIGVLYARLNNNLREFNVTQREVSDITEGVALSLRVSNATVQETNSVMLQLSQSFGSGKLNGQEFLAVAEGAPILLRQLATSMGVPFGALKDLSAQSKITREELSKAFSDPAFLESLRQQVKEVGTVTSSVTVLMNNLKQYIGETDKATTATKLISSSIIFLADNINLLVTGAIVFGITQFAKWTQAQYASVLATKQATAEKVIAARVELSLAQALYASGGAVTRQTVAMAQNASATTLATSNTARLIAAQRGLATATSVTAGAMRTLNTVLMAFGGWIGLAITAVLLFGTEIYKFATSSSPMLQRIKDDAKAMNDELAKTPELTSKATTSSLEQLAVERELLQNQVDKLESLKKQFPESNADGSVDRNIKAKQDLLNASLITYNKIINETTSESELLRKAQREEIEQAKSLLSSYETKSQVLSKYNKELAELNRSADLAKLSDAERAEVIGALDDKYKSLFQSKSKVNDSYAKGLKAIQDQIALDEEEMRLGKLEFYNALAKARNDQILASESSNESLIKEIQSTKDNIEVLRLGEEAYGRLTRQKQLDAIATAEGMVATAKANGATFEAIKYAEDYTQTLKDRLALQDDLDNVKATEKYWEAAKKQTEDAEKERVRLSNEANRDIERANDRLYNNLGRSITDSVVRGFEDGLSFVDNFKRAILNSFKTFVVNVGVNFVQQGLQGLFGKATETILGGISKTFSSDGGGLLSTGKNIFSAVTQGFDTANIAFEQGIQEFGTFITKFGGVGQSLGGAISQFSSGISKALPFTGAALSLLSGDVKGGLFQGAGALIGSKFGPVGSAIGSFLGKAVGGLFGGKKQPPRTVTQLPQVGEQFTSQLSTLLQGLGMRSNVSADASYTGRAGGSGYGKFQTNINGRNNTLYTKDAGAYSEESMNKFIQQVLTTSLVKAIQSTAIPSAFKNLFKGLTDQAEISATISAVVKLNASNSDLQSNLGITASRVALLARESGIAGANLTSFVDAITSTKTSLVTIGEQLVKIKGDINNTFKEFSNKSLPANLKAFDEALKAINTSTKAGRQDFLGLLELRTQFAEFDTAIAGLKGNVNGALFDIVSDAERQQMINNDLAKLFGDLQLEVPASIKELIALGKSIDYTTAQGLNLASVFPTLVDMFNKTKTAVDSLIDSINPSRFGTFTAFQRAQSLSNNGIDISNVPSYDVGTPYVPNDGLAMLHKGERVVTREDNANFGNNAEVVAEIRALRTDNEMMRRELQSIAVSSQRSFKTLDRLERDGFIIRDVNSEGEEQILKVEVVTP